VEVGVPGHIPIITLFDEVFAGACKPMLRRVSFVSGSFAVDGSKVWGGLVGIRLISI
jgi:hypothetical protein